MYWRHNIFINEADEHNNAGSLRPRAYSSVPSFQASTPYSLESESLRMDCIMSGGVSPTLAINAVTNKVRHHLLSDDRFGFISDSVHKWSPQVLGSAHMVGK